jgi:hypothetical protein
LVDDTFWLTNYRLVDIIDKSIKNDAYINNTMKWVARLPSTAAHVMLISEVAVSIAKDCSSKERVPGKKSQPADNGIAYFDREGLELIIDLVLNADEHAPHFLGQLFTSFRQAIDSGLHGVNETRNALAEAIDLIYLHSPEHAAASRLYQLHLEGELKPDDEPLEIINSAITRTTARLRSSKSPSRQRS